MPAGNLLYWALVALAIAVVAAVLGFGGIAGAASDPENFTWTSP